MRKNSTLTTEPSGSVAVATKLIVEAEVVAPCTVKLTAGARPTRLFTTTRRDSELVVWRPDTVAIEVIS